MSEREDAADAAEPAHWYLRKCSDLVKHTELSSVLEARQHDCTHKARIAKKTISAVLSS